MNTQYQVTQVKRNKYALNIIENGVVIANALDGTKDAVILCKLSFVCPQLYQVVAPLAADTTNNPLAITRMLGGADLAIEGKVTESAYGVLVNSEVDSEKVYNTYAHADNGNILCTCPDFENRGGYALKENLAPLCKHGWARVFSELLKQWEWQAN